MDQVEWITDMLDKFDKWWPQKNRWVALFSSYSLSSSVYDYFSMGLFP